MVRQDGHRCDAHRGVLCGPDQPEANAPAGQHTKLPRHVHRRIAKSIPVALGEELVEVLPVLRGALLAFMSLCILWQAHSGIHRMIVRRCDSGKQLLAQVWIALVAACGVNLCAGALSTMLVASREAKPSASTPPASRFACCKEDESDTNDPMLGMLAA